MPEHTQTRTPEEVQPDPSGVIGVLIVTSLWIVALLVFLVLQFATHGTGYATQLWVCGAGVITGVLASWFFIARHRRLLRNAPNQARQN